MRVVEQERATLLADYWLGVDLGQSHDYTALSVVEKIWGKPGPEGDVLLNEKDVMNNVLLLERLPLGTPYPEMVEIIGERFKALQAQRGRINSEGWQEVSIHLAVDATGVGKAVVDMLVPIDPQLRAISITGGDAVNRQRHMGYLAYGVPKRELVSGFQVLLQSRRLRVAQGIPEAANLMSEMKNFRYKLTQAGNDTYAAWRESDRDDLVLSVAIALWCAAKWRRNPSGKGSTNA